MKDDLVAVLEKVGKSTGISRMPDGSEILVMPYGGRILGLFALGDSTNFLWTHPALGSAESARAFYESDEWQNSGGDRTWISPEVEFFFRSFPPKVEEYWQQRQLDPGDYKVEIQGERVSMLNRLSLQSCRRPGTLELTITKRIGCAPNPIRYEDIASLSDIRYAGYSLSVTLEIVGESTKADFRASIWNLLQLPNGGELLVSTFSKTDPKVYFGEVNPDDISAEDHILRYRMHAAGGQKIGIRAVDTPGRVGYLYSAGDGEWSLVVRNFSVDPSGEYVDGPWDSPDEMGYCVQACNARLEAFSFSELEYHAPAIGHGTGRTSYTDESQVWAFRGPREPVLAIARKLLSADI